MLPRYQSRYDVLCQHFKSHTQMIEAWFMPTRLFDSVDKNPQENARLYHLSLPKLAEYIANTLSEVGSFERCLNAIRTHRNIIQVGWYMPRGDVRFPVFFALTMAEGDEHSVVNYVLLSNQPALVLMASTEGILVETLTALAHKGFLFVSLQQLACEGALIEPTKVANNYRLFNQMHPKTQAQQCLETFPTPPGANWQDITIVPTDNHTVHITCDCEAGFVSRSYNYTKMGMENKRTLLPTTQWELLLMFLNNGGKLIWHNHQVAAKYKAQKHLLEGILKDFLGKNTSPFKSISGETGHSGYQALFNVSSE